MASNTETTKLPESQLIAIVAAIIHAADLSYGIDASVKDAVELIQKSSIASGVKP
jgi:hypothetical protein